MSGRMNVVISQGQSRNPEKRRLEESLVAELLGQPNTEVSLVPNLYDLNREDTALLALEGIRGPMVVLSWHYPRAAFWTLAQLGIRGEFGRTLLVAEAEDGDDLEEQEEADDEAAAATSEVESPAIASGKDRPIYCIDLRATDSVADYLEEIERIRREATTKVVALGIVSNLTEDSGGGQEADLEVPASAPPPRRRWYPVIDYERCTNCMECIDFCLFGVYGVDAAEQILVEQPDNCRKGCPACSRVCPENAIIFPQHKSPAIAGGAVGDSGLKIDLSLLFGAPSAQEVAARERDEQLILAGRSPVSQQQERDARAAERNELDDMLDELDALEL